MKTINIFVQNDVYESAPKPWEYGQGFDNYYLMQFSEACKEVNAGKCTIYPVSELERYPDVISGLNIVSYPVVIIYDDETEKAIKSDARKEEIVRAYNSIESEGREGVNPFADGSGFNPFGLFKSPLFLLILLALILSNGEKR